MTVGRNDPCPCGSGKKYKKCCGSAEKKTAGMAAARYEQALNALRNGRSVEALGELRALLNAAPDHAAATHLAGVLSFECGDPQAARDFMTRAVTLAPREAQWHSDLAHVLSSVGDHEAAIRHARTAVELDANLPDAHNHLGNALLTVGRTEEAERHYRAAVALSPLDPWFQLNLAVCLQQRNGLAEAEQLYRKVMELSPQDPTAYANLGALCMQRRRPKEARALLDRAMALRPTDVSALNNLGLVLMELGEPVSARKLFERVLALDPKFPGAVANLLSAFSAAGDLDSAHALAVRCLDDRDTFPSTISQVVKVLGRTVDVRNRDRAFKYLLQPGTADVLEIDAAENVLMALNYSDMVPADVVFGYHVVWGEKMSAIPQLAGPPKMPALAGRRLRIGYVSPDFKEHSVGYFVRDFIEHHDRDRFEVYGYFAAHKRDSVTEAVALHCHRFREVWSLTDAEFAEAIRADGIDILVDLAGHSAHNRLAVFANRPAPVQITYLGYPNTTGLEAMDYRISDPYADVDDGTRYTERLLRLPECFLCFGSFPSAGKGDLPADRNGFVTFGSFNALPKINASVVRAWSRVLSRVPDSRLLIKAAGADLAISRANVELLFNEHGIGPERLTLKGWVEDPSGHLREYDQVDIALDTFPYGGTTTTCQALWMGVPVVTTVGKVHAHRVGYSILTNVGLAELAARDEDEFVDVAARLASDRNRLAAMRRDIPERLKASILCQPARFTRQLEQAYLAAIVSGRGCAAGT